MTEMKKDSMKSQESGGICLSLESLDTFELQRRDSHGRTPFLLAAAQGDVERMRVLLAAGSDPSAQCSDGSGALHLAARRGDAESVSFLIGVSNPNLRTTEGMTPLMSATIAGWRECTRLLMGVSNLDETDRIGQTALMKAAELGKGELVELLLEGSDPSLHCILSLTALMYAAQRGAADCVRTLSVHGAKAKSNSGKTALMLAAIHGHEDCVRILLPISDVEIKDKEGRDAEDFAVSKGHIGCADSIRGFISAREDLECLSKESSKPSVDKPKRRL